MVAELFMNFRPSDFIRTDLCLLDYRYEELSVVLNSEPLRREIESIGAEGVAFLNDAESFLEARDESGIHEPTDISGEMESRLHFTYRLSLGIINKINVYLESLAIAESKQKYNA